MTKRMVIMLIAVAIVFGGIFGFQAFKASMIKKFMTAMGSPPQTVSATKAGYGEWQPKLEAVGSLRAVLGADLSLEVAGVVDTITFNSGDDIEQGKLLLKLRADDDVAKLESLQAVAELNEIIYERDQKQFKMQAVSQATLDTDAANLKNAKAQVAQQQAILDKKFLRAPFDGHLGIRAVDLGQYLSAGTPIVTLQALDPIFVDFFVPQQSVDQVRLGQTVDREDRRIQGSKLCRRNLGDQSEGRCRQPQRPDPRDLEESGSQAAAGNVCDGGHRHRVAAELHHPAADGDQLIIRTAIRFTSSTARRGTPPASRRI